MVKQIEEPQEGVLTGKMDYGTEEYKKFVAKVKEIADKRTDEQKRNVELLGMKYRMEDYINLESEGVILAGQFLKMILKALDIKQNKFAEYIDMKPSNLSKILNGERPINYDLALILGKLFKHDPLLWIKIQAKNELNNLLSAEKSKYKRYSLNDLIDNNKKAI